MMAVSPDIYEAKARAELEAADVGITPAPSIAWTGLLLADIAVVKGVPGSADVEAATVLAGEDGAALRKALVALDRGQSAVFATVSRPWAQGDATASAVGSIAHRLACQLEAVDPDVIIALDSVAAGDVAEALGVPAPAFGEVVNVHGRRFVAVDGLEASLSDPTRKARVWRQLKAIGTL